MFNVALLQSLTGTSKEAFDFLLSKMAKALKKKSSSTWFRRTMDVFHKVKKYIIWFDKARIQARRPPRFHAVYPKTRSIINYLKIYIECPDKRNWRIHTYPNFTVKFLIGISPSGDIMVISKAFSGL